MTILNHIMRVTEITYRWRIIIRIEKKMILNQHDRIVNRSMIIT